jgi:hypothetical protein
MASQRFQKLEEEEETIHPALITPTATPVRYVFWASIGVLSLVAFLTLIIGLALYKSPHEDPSVVLWDSVILPGSVEYPPSD